MFVNASTDKTAKDNTKMDAKEQIMLATSTSLQMI